MIKPNTYRLRTVARTFFVVFGLLVFFAFSAVYYAREATAAPTTYLNFQGRLKTSSGTTVPDGNYNIEFKIYDAITAGNLLWTETRTGGDRVRVVNGYFSVSLGSVNPFGTSITDWSEEHFITMNIGGTGSPSWDGEMTNAGNRMILTAVPYAFQADRANTANALTDGTNDYTANDFLRIAPGSSQGTSSSDAAVRLNQTGAGGLLQLQSGGTDMFTLSNSGDAVLAGDLTVGEDLTVGTNSLVVDSANDRVGIGTTTTTGAVLTVVGTAPDVAGGSGLRVETTLNTTTNNRDQYGNTFLTTVSPSGAGGSSAYFGLGGAITSSANLSNDIMTALSMGAVYSGTTSAARVQGIDSGAVNASTGTVGELIGQAVTVTNVGGTVNYAVGMNIGINNAATINNTTYLLIGASAIPTGNWGIYNDSTYDNYFAGSLQVDGGITIGTSDTTGTLLVLDTKTDSGDPTGTNGGMYYNSNSNTFRFYQNGSWVNLGTGDILNGGNGGAVTIGTNSNSSLTFETNNQSAMTIASGGAVALQNATNSTAAFSVTNTSGNSPLVVDTTGTYGKVIMEALQFSGSSASALSFTTPQGSTVYTKILIPLYDPGAGMQHIALGLPAGAVTNTRAITLFDNRSAGNNQPVLAVLSPNENNIFGLNTDGSNTVGWLKGVGMNVGLRVGTTDFLQTVSSTGNLQVGTSDTTGQQLVLDTKTDAGDPTGVNGGMYYNSNSGKFRCYEGGAWKDCITSGGGSVTLDGDENMFGGTNAFASNVSGSDNLAFGFAALNSSTTGSANLAFGGYSLNDSNGFGNIGVGYNTLRFSTGSGNIALGYEAGYNLTAGDNNIAIGPSVNFGNTTGSNQLNIAGILTSSDYTSGNLSVAGDLSLGLNGSGEGILSLYGSEGNAATIAALNSFGGTIMTFQASGVNDYVAQFRDCCNAVFEVGATGIASRFNYGLEVDGGGITIGDSDTTGELLVLDTKTDAGDPTGVNGGMYYNSDSGKFRCYEGGTWKDCISAGTGDVVNGGQNGTVTLGTNDANPLNFETGGNTHMTVEADGDVVVQNGNSAYSATAFRVSDATDDWRGIVVDTDTQGVHLGAHNWTSGFDGGSGFTGYFENNAFGTMNGENAWDMNGRMNGSTAATQTGFMMQSYVDATPDSNYHNYRGLNMRLQGHNLSANTANSYFTGIRTELEIDGSGSAQSARALDLYGNLGAASTLGELYGAQVSNDVNGTTTNLYGIRIASSGSGTVTNNYGIRIDNQTIGTNDYGLYIQGADTYALYVAAGSSHFNGQVSLGTSDTTGTLLVLDTKTDSGDPTGVNGGMYYNSNAGKFRCYEGGAWKDCISAAAGDVMNGGQNGTVTLGTNDSNALNFETGGTTRWSVNTSGHLLPGADDTYDIGSDTLRVRDIYVGPASIHIGESGDEVVLSFDTATDMLSINQSLSVQGDIISNGTSLNLNATGTQAVNIATGTSTGEINIGNASSGDVSIYSSGTVGMYGNGGSVGIEVGSVFGLSVNTMQFSGTGTKNIRTTAQSTQHSAGIDLYTGNVTGGTSRNTGDLSIRTGNGSGTTTNSGSITIDTGSATGTAGSISIGATNASSLLLGRNGISVNVGGNLTIGTSDTTATFLILDTKTDAEGALSGVNGAMYYNSNSGKFRCYQGGAWMDCIGTGNVRLAASSTAPSNTISNTTTETNFSGTGNTYVIPANTCTVGKTYRVTATGVQSFVSGGGWGEGTMLNLKLGSVTLASTSWSAMGDSDFTDQMWRLEAQFTCTAAPSGSSAIEAQGIATFFRAMNSSLVYPMSNTSTVNVATNANQTLQVSARFYNNASASDSITMRQFIVEEMGP